MKNPIKRAADLYSAETVTRHVALEKPMPRLYFNTSTAECNSAAR